MISFREFSILTETVFSVDFGRKIALFLNIGRKRPLIKIITMKIFITLFTSICFCITGTNVNALSSLRTEKNSSDEFGGTPCAGTPSLSNTLSTSNAICEGENFTLTLDQVYLDGGITYQWQSSTDGFSYSDIIGANGDNLTLNQTETTFYQCVITCTFSTLSTISTATMVTDYDLPSTSVSQTNVTCFGDNDGTINLTVSGGAGGYTFDWDMDGTGDFDDLEDLSGLSGGNYSGVVMDLNGCTDGGTITITEPDLLTVSLSSTDITCNGLDDGMIDMTIAGGTSAYLVDWDNDGTGDNDDTEDLNSLAGGTYNVVVTDANACTANGSATIINPTNLSATAFPIDIQCNGDNDGEIDLVVTGGTGGYAFDWDNDGTGDNDDTEDLTGLSPGTYNVTAYDANGCAAGTGAGIAEPSAINTSVSQTNVSCFGDNDGTINLTVSGGVGSYTFDWDIDGTGDFDDTEDLSGLTAGVYTGVLMDGNGCTDGGTITITEPDLLTVSLSSTDITCNGLDDGMIDMTITGGTIAYQIDWDNDGTGDNDDAEDLNSLAGGTYSVIVTDANSCVANTSATIINPTNLSATAFPIDIQCNGDNDGEIDLVVTGGTGGYAFDWDNDGTGDNDDTEDLTGLSQGTYNVTVYDANGCAAGTGAGIAEPSAINVNVATQNVSCFSMNDGEISLTVSGGAGGYTFDWDTDGTGDFDDTEDLSGLTAGVYNGVVMDANGCTDGGSVTISEPNLLVASLVATNISCNGMNDGMIDMTITGGTIAYQIDWDNDGTGDNDDAADLGSLSGGTYTVVVTDANNCTAINTATIVNPAVLSITLSPIDLQCNGDADGSIGLSVTGGTSSFTYDWDIDGTGDNDDTEDLSGLSGGTYSVVVTDSRGCTTSQSAGVFEPTAIITNVSYGDITCYGMNDGFIDLSVSGGMGSYTFDWDTDGTGDFNDTEDLTNLGPGVYNGVLMDANGCTDGGSITIIEPDTISLVLNANDISCNGANDGSIDLTISGGTSSYTIDWDNDGTGDNDDAEDLSSLSDGTFNLYVEDVNGCFNTASATIVNPDVFSVSMTTQEITCNGTGDGMADVTISGGTLPYSIDWDNDGTGDNDDAEDLSGMGGGTFTVAITDANGCNPYSNTVTFVDPGVITLTSTTTDAICNNVANGTLDLTVAGGNGGFEFIWSNSNITEDLTNVAAGIYLVVVTDTNGCSQTLTDTIAFTNSAPTVTLALNPDVFCNTTTSALTLSGESPIGGNWSGTGISSNMFNPSVAGIGSHVIIYTYTDGNGCFNTAVDMAQVDDCTGIDELTENPFQVYPNPTDGIFTVNIGSENGKVAILNAIGETVYMNEINGQMNIDLSGVESGIYFVVFSNENGNTVQKLIKN